MSARTQAATVAGLAVLVAAGGLAVGRALDTSPGRPKAPAAVTATTDEPETATTVAPTTTVLPTTTTTTAPAGVSADVLNSAVTQATIGSTICVKGWTATVRPPQSYTGPLKIHQIATYGYAGADANPANLEEDHVIALETGGSPRAVANLFPEPHRYSVPDDQLENALKAQVCSGARTLADAQAALYAVKVQHGYTRAKSAA